MADHADDILTTVATGLDFLAASLVKSRLQDEGIEAYVPRLELK